MHWPESKTPGGSNREMRAETWRALEELYKEGKWPVFIFAFIFINAKCMVLT